MIPFNPPHFHSRTNIHRTTKKTALLFLALIAVNHGFLALAVNKNAVKEMGMRAMLLDIKGPCSPKLPRLCKPMDRSTDFESLMREIRIVPYLINGNIEGFKIFAIQQDSYFRYLGFENGDVVLKINGHSVRSAETAIDQFKNLVSDSKPAKIRILRGIPAKNYPVN